MTLHEFLNSEYWEIWDLQNRSPGSARMILGDPERFDRICAAAEYGGEGSTHGEIIDGWRRALACAALDGVFTEGAWEALEREIDRFEEWHEGHGFLEEVIG